MTEKIINVKDVTKHYGEVEAVKGISFSIKKGELFGLIGPNGAGKTTLFKMLLGLIRPTSGTISVMGSDVSEVWSREVRAHTGYLPENIAFYDHLTGLETLSFYASIKGAKRSEIAELLDLTGISNAAGRKVGGYSKGMRQRLGLAQSLLSSPRILFLDEPTTGLDPEGIGAFYRILNDVKARGVTIVLTSHILKEIQDRVDRLGIIGGGKLLASGSVKELRSDLGLSPVLRLTVKGNAEGLQRAAQKSGGDVQSFEEGTLLINCPGGNKMEVLRALMKEDDAITDLELLEPSLEDVFMGYASEGYKAGGDA